MEFACDPEWPILTSSVMANLARTGTVECQVYDAETAQDLERIVDASLRQLPLVFVGSLGLADAVANRLAAPPPPPRPIPRSVRPLIVSGSRYARSHVQLDRATAMWGCAAVVIHPGEESVPENPVTPQGPRILCLPAQPVEGLGPEAAVKSLAEIASRVAERSHPDGLAVVGGETAFALLTRLGAVRLRVYGLLENVVSCGTIEGGMLDGAPFMLKGGSVGTDDAVVKMLDHFKRGTP